MTPQTLQLHVMMKYKILREEQVKALQNYESFVLDPKQWDKFLDLVGEVQTNNPNIGCICVEIPEESLELCQNSEKASSSEFKLPFVLQTAQHDEAWDNFKTVVTKDCTPNLVNEPDKTVDTLEWRPFPDEHPGAEYAYDIEADKADELRNKYGLYKSPLLDLMGKASNCISPAVDGISSSFLYFGKDNSFSPMHMEDYRLSSVNFVHRGRKLWHFVLPSELHILCRYAHKIWRESHPKLMPCDQFTRHLARYLPTRVFDKLGIGYATIRQTTRHLVWTFPATLHQVHNQGSMTIAEAVNINWPVSGSSCVPYLPCSIQCETFLGGPPILLSILPNMSNPDVPIKPGDELAFAKSIKIRQYTPSTASMLKKLEALRRLEVVDASKVLFRRCEHCQRLQNPWSESEEPCCLDPRNATDLSRLQIYLTDTPNMGFGVKTQIAVDPDKVLGIIIGNETLKRPDHREVFEVDLGKRTNKRSYFLEPLNWTAFINDSSKPNCGVFRSHWQGRLYLYIRTLRSIRKEEQLTIRYGPAYWKDHSVVRNPSPPPEKHKVLPKTSKKRKADKFQECESQTSLKDAKSKEDPDGIFRLRPRPRYN